MHDEHMPREIGRITDADQSRVGARQRAACGRAGDRPVAAPRRRRRRNRGTDAEHARRLVDDALARGTDALVVVGGDGIISLALQALANGDIPLGIIPAGTGNDHAREYRIPTKIPRPRPTSSSTAAPKPSTSAASRARRHRQSGSAP